MAAGRVRRNPLDSPGADRGRFVPFMSREPRFSIARLVALLPLVLLLLGGTYTAAVHHHDGAGDSCAVCVYAATPASDIAALPSAPAPVETSERLAIFAVLAPVPSAPVSTATRAPPTA